MTIITIAINNNAIEAPMIPKIQLLLEEEDWVDINDDIDLFDMFVVVIAVVVIIVSVLLIEDFEDDREVIFEDFTAAADGNDGMMFAVEFKSWPISKKIKKRKNEKKREEEKIY